MTREDNTVAFSINESRRTVATHDHGRDHAMIRQHLKHVGLVFAILAMALVSSATFTEPASAAPPNNGPLIDLAPEKTCHTHAFIETCHTLQIHKMLPGVYCMSVVTEITETIFGTQLYWDRSVTCWEETM